MRCEALIILLGELKTEVAESLCNSGEHCLVCDSYINGKVRRREVEGGMRGGKRNCSQVIKKQV